MKQKDKDKLNFIIENPGEYLTEWDTNFIDDLSIKQFPELSMKQWKNLNRIYHKALDYWG